MTTVKGWQNDAGLSDADVGDSTTDPDIETDNTSSDSDSDGYAEVPRFCRKQHQKQYISPNSRWNEPQNALRGAGKREFTKFLYWLLRVERGQDRRRTKGIRRASTLGTYWKNFLRYYEKANEDSMPHDLARRMRKSIRKIVKTKGLITDEKEKPPLYIEDVVVLQEAVLRTMEKRFYIGLQRMQQCLYNLMACFTVNRISAMRMLQYKHIQCSIQRDPKGGPPRILLEITYEFAKKYLGVTQGNTFIIPEIIHDPSLMLSPHEFLLGILFDDDAFRAPAIRSRDDLRKLWLEDGRQQLQLPLKHEKADHYVFCKVVATRGVIQIVRDQPISSTALGKQYQTFGEIAGFPNLYTHCNRYGGGTILNQSSKSLSS
ncbi:hypothetical protein PENSUB_4626 [Penicillium subrubescens]|uniref:Uncharacterized protein n=1 Tax=Penicillium subrubescens TaxID=1316194 RepID=A0A1Q5UBR1_9EURO|nr:hypothetical protein PENSUB_4626 [Penicillium subrubescens]